MFHLDNSETSWLVYADWLEDQDIDATHIREMNPVTNYWTFEYTIFGEVGDSYVLITTHIGCIGGGSFGIDVGSLGGTPVGCGCFRVDVGGGKSNDGVGGL